MSSSAAKEGSAAKAIFVGLAAILLLLFSSRLTGLNAGTFRGAAPVVISAGVLGIGIISGVAYSLPRTGIAAGMLGIILGQMVVAVVVDSNGWGGLDPIPLTFSRIAGLASLVVATWLVLPRTP